MVYLKLFNTEQERLSCTDNFEYVTYVEESDKVYIHLYDYSQDYLTFVAKSNGTFSFSGTSNDFITNKIQYSTNDGETWSEANQVVEINVNNGDKVMWKGEMNYISNSGVGSFYASTASFDVQGNIMSLLYNDIFADKTSLEDKFNIFLGLFSDLKIINAQKHK